jgi:hypothetical protein
LREVGVDLRRKQIVAVDDKFFQGDLEIAIEQDQSDTIFRIELLLRNYFEQPDDFNQAKGPKVSTVLTNSGDLIEMVNKWIYGINRSRSSTARS